MSEQTKQERQGIVVYTNDLALERVKQANAGEGQERLGVLRNRIARSKAANLVAIATVAAERNDATISKDARARLQEMGVLASGQKLADVVTVVESRRPSRSKEFATLTGQPVEAPVSDEAPAVEAPAEDSTEQETPQGE